MEHLVFIPQGPQGVVTASRNLTLATDWTYESDVIPFQPPLTPWLGFDHQNAATSLDLELYPRRRGWNYQEIWQGNLRESHASLASLDGHSIANRVVAMLQSWFYIGLLESVIDKPVSPSYVVRTDKSAVAYLYSRNLHFCLQAWIFKIRLENEVQKEAMNLRILNSLGLVSDWIKRMNIYADRDQKYFYRHMEASYPGFGKTFTPIVPSIIRLGEAIDCARLTTFGKVPSALSWHYPDSEFSSQISILKDRGWCPYTLRILGSSAGASTIDWLTTFNVWVGNEGREHERCTESVCERNYFAWEKYKIKHRQGCDGHGCRFLKPPLEKTLDILKRGYIPVINFQYDGTISVSARSTQTQGDYLAFSHVWVDGIGSTTEEGLPACQFAFLRDVACDVMNVRDPAFWIDSLCVPSRRSARRKAIIVMHATYFNASEVVVLDKTIQLHSITSPSEVTFCAIFTSGWMQRLWTFQEALLAQRLIFKLSDGLYKLDALEIMKYGRSSLPSSICHVWRALGSQLLRLRGTGSTTRNIASVSRDLAWRCTARYTDETLAIAGVLGIDATLLLEETEGNTAEVDDDEPFIQWSDLCENCKAELELQNRALAQRRMAITLKIVAELPRDIIFLKSPKLSIENFTWAPETLMSRSSYRVGIEALAADCTDAGLTSYWWLLTQQLARKADNKEVKYVGSFADRCVYRIFFQNTWPTPPEEWEYEAIVLDGNISDNFLPGQSVNGLAVMKVFQASGRTTYRPVGPVLVEKLHFEEAFLDKQSMMFSPPPEGITVGDLSWETFTLI
ncbi:uncharacterized protein K444DRAFT_660349 [Hyaloscypha bicolor E]|uniref:Heterokaryon incompatibility domain-containing protein n=1 Tax=Hyaloscypha bicolor E TaxID=1095630 RepID=A0A2J6TNH0_9HELO|nr:uncharacterized protein K444DRAFT_660349 [Hyaloscypha bicolor E]PMD64566.1 hypothetical protein K444DRAFT_660349 [Hyaloscypha bicolor E]